MTSSDGAPPMRWLNEHCTLFDPAVYGSDFRMRCNHASCSVSAAKEDADLGLDIGDNAPRGKITFSSSSDEEEAPPAPMLVDAEAEASDISGDESDISLDESDEDFVDDGEQASVDHAAVASATAAIEARTAEEEAQAAAERARQLQAREAEEEEERDERRAQKARERQVVEERRQREAADEARRLQDEASVRAAREELEARQDSGIHIHVILLKYQETPRVLAAPGIFQSDSSLWIDRGGSKIYVGGDQRTAGFQLLDTVKTESGPLGKTFCLSTVDTIDQGVAAGLVFEPENKLEQTDEFIIALARLREVGQKLYAEDNFPLLGNMCVKEEKLPLDMRVVPDLTSYIKPLRPLVLTADCATQKSRGIVKWLKSKLQYNPQLRVICISCRIVHALDLYNDLRGAGLDFGLYTERGEQGAIKSRVVCQFNSIKHYAGETDYHVVILDEVVSMLAYFTPGNSTLSDIDHRRSQLAHVMQLERLCAGATFLLLADAHIDMDGRVADFLEGVLSDKPEILKLVLRGKNPACRRTLETVYDPNPVQKPLDLTAAAAAVLEDPEQRIAVCCGSARLLSDAHREAGSYETMLRQLGLTKIVVLHGKVGEDEKRLLCERLDDTLTECQALLSTCALTVGLNPRVPFGKIHVHLHKNGASVRDIFQLMQRFGRDESLLANGDETRTVSVVVHDKAPLVKAGERQSIIAAGGTPPPTHTFNDFHREIVKSQRATEAQNGDRMEIAPTVADGAFTGTRRVKGNVLPDWVLKLYAWNLLEAKRSNTTMSEEFERYAKHHNFDIVVKQAEAAAAPVTDQGEVPLTDNAVFETTHGFNRYELARSLFVGSDVKAQHLEFLHKLEAGEAREAVLTTCEKVISDGYYKIYVPLGRRWVDTDELFADIDPEEVGNIKKQLWDEGHLMKARGTQLVQEHCHTMRYDVSALIMGDGAVDLTLSSDESQRVLAGLKMRELLGIESLVQSFSLPTHYVNVINMQLVGSGLEDTPTELYNALALVPRDRKILVPTKPRTRGSWLYVHLKQALRVYGMEPTHANGIVVGRRGQPSRLREDYGYVPIGGQLADERHVYVPMLDTSCAIKDVPEQLATVSQAKQDDLWAEELGQFDTISIQRGTVKYVERYDVGAAEQLLAAITQDPKKFTQRFKQGNDDPEKATDSVVCDLKKIIADGPTNEVIYLRHNSCGRRYASSNVSLQNIDGGVRKLVAGKYFWDIDFVNCFPMIITRVCKAFDHPVPVLDKYVQDRDIVLDQIKSFYDCTRDDAKTLVLRYLHGGKVGKWLRDVGIRDELCAKAAREGHCPVVTQLETECKQVCKFFLTKFPQFQSLLDHMNAKRVSEGKDRKGAASGLAHGLQDLEDRLLQRLETFLAAKGYEVGSLEYDGVKVYRDGATGPFPDAVLREAEGVLATHNLGSAAQPVFIGMKLAEKSMASKYKGFVDNAVSQPAETQAELRHMFALDAPAA
jgi:hypothetical protein